MEAYDADRVFFRYGCGGGGWPDFSLDEDATDGQGVPGPEGLHGCAKGAD